MKKRLRKKKRVKEFTEWGRELIIIRNCKEDFDEFLDAFIEQAIEANRCFCGGGGKEDKLSVVVELGRGNSDPDSKMAGIVAWLKSRPDIQTWKIGPEFDLWHGEYQDIEEE